MPHEHPEQQALRLKLYQAFLAARDAAPMDGAFMPYNWTTLPDPISGLWLPYTQMLDEFARELANAVNRLTHQVHQLRAWSHVVQPLSDDEKMEATHEFIETLATAAVSSPYVIKSRFSYAAAHLCHQANMAKDLASWKDAFPTERAIYLNHAAPFGKGWRSFRRFMCCAEAIGGRAFQAATGDFRNAYNHRFPQRFVLGQTGLVTRRVDQATGQISYAIGGAAALQLDDVADLLATERDLAQATFKAFQLLVREHEGAITAFEQARATAAS